MHADPILGFILKTGRQQCDCAILHKYMFQFGKSILQFVPIYLAIWKIRSNTARRQFDCGMFRARAQAGRIPIRAVVCASHQHTQQQKNNPRIFFFQENKHLLLIFFPGMFFLFLLVSQVKSAVEMGKAKGNRMQI